MQLVAKNYLSILINILLEKYFSNLTTTCVFWPQNWDLELKTSSGTSPVFLQINSLILENAFEDNLYNYSKREQRDNANNIYYKGFITKLIAAIEHTHCEGFLAFQDDIPRFAKAFQKASIYSIWRSINNRFLFAYFKDQEKDNYFKHLLFKDQFNILVIEAESYNSSVFHLKTNKFVGPTCQHPEEFLPVSSFYSWNQSFVPDVDLFPANKLRNLKGREIVVGAFDYRPFVAVDFKGLPLYNDQASDNPSHLVHVDGTEIRTCHTFCELYNCSVQFDTSEKEEWGLAFSNYSGYGLIGLITERKIHMAFGAMYAVYPNYVAIDMTFFIGRSGVTCLVPAASALTSWDLPLRPFKLTLWLAVFGCLCLETIVLFAARKFEYEIADRKSNWWTSLQFCYIITLKLFINQSTKYLVKSNTLRTLLFSCYMLDVILTSVYGGGLASVLTLPIYGETADTVERLDKYHLSWTGSSYAWLASINETEGDGESIYRRLINNFELNTMDEMRSKAKYANMAFILERMTYGHFGGGKFLTTEALHRLKLMLEDIYFQYTVAWVPRLWPHLEKYNNLLLLWHSSGLDKFWEWKSTAEYLNTNVQKQVKDSKDNVFDKRPTKLNMQNLAGLIALWFIGMMLSVVAFGGEIVWYKLRKHKGI